MTKSEMEIFVDEMSNRGDNDWTIENLSNSSYGKMSLEEALRSRIKSLDQMVAIMAMTHLR